MTRIQEAAVAAIEAQQAKLQRGSAPWVVGEQLKDICREEPNSAELIVNDLQVAEMSLKEAEKKIKAAADKKKVGNFAFISPMEADGILRKFYGLPDRNASERQATDVIRLEDFL